MLSGRKKKDYETQSAAEALAATANSAADLDDAPGFGLPGEPSPADPVPVGSAG